MNSPSEKNNFAGMVQNFVEKMSGTTEKDQSSKNILNTFFNQVFKYHLRSNNI
jgi:hypothetical protein